MTARVTAGVTMGTPLVEDVLGGPVSLGTGVAPTLAIALEVPIDATYRGMIEVRASRGTLAVDDDGTDDELGNLTTASVMGLVNGPLFGAFRWEVGAGIITYRPADRGGVFAQGGPSPWILGAGLSWTRALNPSTDFVAGARYDFHQFRTRQLETRGYSQYQTVHRVGIGVGVARRF